MRLAPPIPDFHERLARRIEESGGDPLPEWKRASALDPRNADRLMRLAAWAEISGDREGAEAALLRAAAASRLFQPRYALAQFYFRQENPGRFLEWARAAMASAPGEVSALLDLCWRLRPDSAWMARELAPERPALRRQILSFFRARQDVRAAQEMAERIACAAAPEDVRVLREYIDWRLSEGAGASAASVWNALAKSGLLSLAAVARPGAFDWHLESPPGVIPAERAGDLRIAFSGKQPEATRAAWQFWLVEPGVRYRVSADVRAVDAPSTEGIEWLLAGDVSSDVRRLELIYRRPAGSPRLEGIVEVRGVRLERAP